LSGRVLRAVMVAAVLGLGPAAAQEGGLRRMDVRQTPEGYAADAVLWVPVPREKAFAVLIDFEHMADWVPNLQSSRVLTRAPGRATVEYEGAVRYGFLTIPFRTRRQIEFSSATSIRTTQTQGSMKRHESRMDFAVEGTGTRIDYHVEMDPNALAALVMSERRVASELSEHVKAIAAEILRRNAPAPPASP